jgi:hypothetical protein
MRTQRFALRHHAYLRFWYDPTQSDLPYPKQARRLDIWLAASVLVLFVLGVIFATYR